MEMNLLKQLAEKIERKKAELLSEREKEKTRKEEEIKKIEELGQSLLSSLDQEIQQIKSHADSQEERAKLLVDLQKSALEKIDQLSLKNEKVKHGIYLAEPDGEWIADGKKTAIVKKKALSEEYVERDVFLCSGKFVYGIINLDKPKEINLEEFKDLEEKHQVSDERRVKWWGEDTKEFFYYTFKMKEKFKEPKEYEYEPGVQREIKEVKFKVKKETGKKEVELSDGLKSRLQSLPETGMGYQLVNFKLKDGTILENIVVINSSIALLDKDIDATQIEDISSGITTTDDIDVDEILYAPITEEEIDKLDLGEFRSEGIDEDLKDPLSRWRELLADHRYLHIGWNRLKQGKKWGEFSKDDLVFYHAKITDVLRGKCFFPMLPGEKKD